MFPLLSATPWFYFYPRPPRGGRRFPLGRMLLRTLISIHALREEGDHRRGAGCHNGGAISIHALRRADRYARREISIHALREEGDGIIQRQSCFQIISIHALREEGDFSKWVLFYIFSYFYPRPPRGGRPGALPSSAALVTYFYPRPPRGGRRAIHAAVPAAKVFLSTPSARRATRGAC